MLLLNDNLKKRLFTILIGAPIVISILYVGGLTLKLALAVALFFTLYEWFSMAKKSKFKALISLFGLFYIMTGFASLYILGGISFFAILMVLLCVWASDSVAYVFGKTFGGPKMSPTISPNKTWAGYLGALIGPMIIMVTGLHNPVMFVLFGVVMGVVGQSGDLLVSALKRHVNVKDTGKLFPGHGGILDRIDALLLVAPVYLVGIYIL